MPLSAKDNDIALLVKRDGISKIKHEQQVKALAFR